MSRIAGLVLTRSELIDCGRLVRVRTANHWDAVDFDFDSSEQIGSWLVPSGSRDNRIYVVQCDFATLEARCACECFKARTAPNSIMNPDRGGHFIEHAAVASGELYIFPLIVREPRHLCRHLKLVRAYLKRRKGVWQAIRAIEKAHTKFYEQAERSA